MAAGDVVYGTRTALANISRLDGDTANLTTAFGEIDNTTTKALDYLIYIEVPISSSATTGAYYFYLVVSQDGAAWTDHIDPAADIDYTDFLKDARQIRAVPTIYDNSPTGARTSVAFHFNVLEIMPGYAVPPFIGLVCVDKSGQTIPSGSVGYYVPIKIATS